MILKTAEGNRELYGPFDSSVPIPRASQYGGNMSWSGRRVDYEDAIGLPAFMRGVRLLTETTAGMPLHVYRGFGEGREGVPQSEQAVVLRHPNDDMAPFAVWSYVVTSMLRSNAYLWKVKVGKSVKALYPLDPRVVTPKYDGSEPRFEIRDRPTGPKKRIVGRETILHLPGILVNHPCIGVGVIEAYRNGLGTYLGRQEFEARFLANDGFPGVVLKHPDNQTEKSRNEIRDSFAARHQGPSNAGRPAIVWGGWELDRLSVSLEDAQFVATANFSVQEIGRMLGIPAGLLGDPEAPGRDTPEQENMRFLQFGLTPWIERLAQGLASDADLFPNRDMSVELDPSHLLRADIKTRFDAYRLARQGGWITANEIRSKEGYDAAEGGDEIQQTPVGGAVNEPSEPSNGATNPDDENRP